MEIIRERYTLREWRPTDKKSLAYNINNKHIWNNLRDALPNPYTEQDAENFIEKVREKTGIYDFAIQVGKEAVGGISCTPQNDIERFNAEIGYWIGEKYWNKGIMSLALKDAVHYIFQNTSLIRLYAKVFESNYPSMKVLENVGFEKIAIFKKAAVKQMKIIDIHYYQLLKH